MKNLLVFLFGFLFFFACSKEDAGTDSIYRKDGYAQIIDEEVTRYFEKTESDHLVLSAATPAAYIPSVGNILCCRITGNTPDGFLGRVTRVDRGADGISVYTEPVPLDEAFENLEGESRAVTSSIESIIDESGGNVAFEYVDERIWSELESSGVVTSKSLESGTRASLDKTVEFKFTSGGDDISLEGQIYLKLSAKFNIKLHKGVEYINLEINPRAGIKGNLVAKKPDR